MSMNTASLVSTFQIRTSTIVQLIKNSENLKKATEEEKPKLENEREMLNAILVLIDKEVGLVYNYTH